MKFGPPPSSRAGATYREVARGAGTQADEVAFVRDVADFLERCRRQGDFGELLSRFLDLVRPFGIEQAALVDMSRAAPDPRPSIKFTTFSPEWIADFAKSGRHLDDPVWRGSVSGDRASRWSSALVVDANVPERAVAFYHAIGIVDGLTIPVYTPQALRSVMFLGAVRPLLLDAAEEATITLASSLLAARAFQCSASASLTHRLTDREREVLTWTALGKSAREISTILDMSQKTVVRHLLNIRLKLAAANTVQAVALAMREKIISI